MEFVQSVPGEDPVIVESYFAETPATVFHAWTDPEIVVKWFGYAPNSLLSATIDLRTGGRWSFLLSKDADKTIGFEGEYLDVQPGEKLIYSWAHVTTHADGAREETPASKVEVSFTAQGKGTSVRLVHAGLNSEDARRGVGGGWTAAFRHLTALYG